MFGASGDRFEIESATPDWSVCMEAKKPRVGTPESPKARGPTSPENRSERGDHPAETEAMGDQWQFISLDDDDETDEQGTGSGGMYGPAGRRLTDGGQAGRSIGTSGSPLEDID